MGKFIDLTSKRYGRLVVLHRTTGKRKDKVYWFCQCDCGKTSTVVSGDLTTGNTKSCGCFDIESTIKRNTTHGLSNHPLYNNWCAMKKRCYDQKHPSNKRYRRKGITVCPRWLNSVEAFILDMGKPPTPKHTLDRIDNSKGYSPENCRWSTRSEQARNTSRIKPFYATSPIGRRYRATFQIDFAKIHKLSPNSISNVLRGVVRTHLSWTFEYCK